MREEKKKKSYFKLFIYLIITACILSSSIAYSALNSSLKVTGDVTIANNQNLYKLSKKALQDILKEHQIYTVDINWSCPPIDYTYDVSAGGDGSVRAALWNYSGKTDLYISTFDGDTLDDTKVLVMPDCDSLFQDTTITIVEFGDDVDFSHVQYMDSMFFHCSNLTAVKAEGKYNAPALRDTYYMFAECSKLTDVSTFLPSLITTSVDEMDFMFQECKLLTTIDLRNMGTISDLTVNGLFYGCGSLKTIYLNKADFSRCTAVVGTAPFFYGVPSGLTIYVSNAASKKWFEDALSECGLSGTVSIA